jgi:hypothetical protein
MQTAKEIAQEHFYSELAERFQPSFDLIIDMDMLHIWQSRLDAFIRETIHPHEVTPQSRANVQ